MKRFKLGGRGAEMNLGDQDEETGRFAAYVDGLASVIGHADRVGPLRDYCTGLMLPVERKSRRADGRDDGTGTDSGAASVVAAFCRRC